MKVGILAGGVGSQLSQEATTLPKPMIEIGGRPILWHIMMHYAYYGYKDFYIALGYKGEHIKKYMIDYINLSSNLTVDLQSGNINRQSSEKRDWLVNLIDTGVPTMTGGRIKRLKPYLDDGTFFLAWGDGVAHFDLNELLAFHKSHGKLVTMTAVRPPARFGHLEFNEDAVMRFTEKPQTAEGWINGSFFVMEPGVFDYIEGDEIFFEQEPLQSLAKDGQLMAYKHESFWMCMDTMRDKVRLENLWNEGDAPWKIWE